MINYEEKLSEEQRTICESENNLLVKACPGSGKTRTIIYKLAYRIEKNPNSVKRLVAITYTNRAADEISERIEDLGIDTERIWAGTIHQFCLEWILRRYKMYTQTLNQGFKVIDERVRERYLTEIINGLRLEKPLKAREIKTRYDRQLHLVETDVDKKKVITAYSQLLRKNKELDFDLILAMAYSLLKKNPFIAKDIRDCIELICVDEYQDTQDLQYAIIEEIANSNKNAMFEVNFFGDPNQAIYRSLGGLAKDLATLNTEFIDCTFEEKTLSGCYRSTERIVHFYEPFMVDKYPIEAKGSLKNENGIIKYNHTIRKEDIYDAIARIIAENIADGVPENEICVLAPIWEMLYPFSKEIQDRLPMVKFDAPDITPIKRDHLNIFFKIARLLLTEPNIKKFSYRRKVAKEIIEELNLITGIAFNIDEIEFLNIIRRARNGKEKGSEFVKCGVDSIFETLHVLIDNFPELKKMYDDFFEKMQSRLDNPRYKLVDDVHSFKKMFKEKEGVVINTCHGVKGEEYHTVIAYGLVYGKIPSLYTELAYRDEDANKLLYVIASRAKCRLYLFSEKGYVYKDEGLGRWVDSFPTRQLFQNKNVKYDI